MLTGLIKDESASKTGAIRSVSVPCSGTLFWLAKDLQVIYSNILRQSSFKESVFRTLMKR